MSHSNYDQVRLYFGLRNQGSTCYLNSVLQVLFLTKEFREALESYNYEDQSLDFHLKELFNQLKSETASTDKLNEVLDINRGVQKDAAECFENILSKMSNTEASQVFQGVLTIKNKCSICNKETSTEDPFWSLPLEMEDGYGSYDVIDGITNYFKESGLTEKNQLFCERCTSKTDTTMKVEIRDHPEVLTLLLKRFKFNFESRQHVKVQRCVKIPEYLQIPPYGDESKIYQLYAYVEHSGELRNGHYIAEIKPQHHDKWYRFNDHLVFPRYTKPFTWDTYEINREAYLLFYRNISATDPMKAVNSGTSTSGYVMSNQPSKTDEEPRGQEGKGASALLERDINPNKTTETVNCLPISDRSPECKKPSETTEDKTEPHMTNDRGGKRVVNNPHEQLQAIDGKQDISDKPKKKLPTGSCEDSGAAMAENDIFKKNEDNINDNQKGRGLIGDQKINKSCNKTTKNPLYDLAMGYEKTPYISTPGNTTGQNCSIKKKSDGEHLTLETQNNPAFNKERIGKNDPQRTKMTLTLSKEKEDCKHSQKREAKKLRQDDAVYLFNGKPYELWEEKTDDNGVYITLKEIPQAGGEDLSEQYKCCNPECKMKLNDHFYLYSSEVPIKKISEQKINATEIQREVSSLHKVSHETGSVNQPERRVNPPSLAVNLTETSRSVQSKIQEKKDANIKYNHSPTWSPKDTASSYLQVCRGVSGDPQDIEGLSHGVEILSINDSEKDGDRGSSGKSGTYTKDQAFTEFDDRNKANTKSDINIQVGNVKAINKNVCTRLMNQIGFD